MESYSEMSNVTGFESQAEDVDLRRGPWTVEEDRLLVAYITNHGEGRWNSLARSAGLKRTGKSCRLRWLNYLRPDVRRGNMSAEEQLLILELHSRCGNRWSKIAQHLPGRTDNEIKNYWRTRVQKHAKQMQCDVNSQQFRDAVKYLWMPRLMEQVNNERSSSDLAAHTGSTHSSSSLSSSPSSSIGHEGLRLLVHPGEVQLNQYLTVCESSYISPNPSDSASGVSDSADYYHLPEFAPATELTQAACADSNQGSSYPSSNQTSSSLHQDQFNIQPRIGNWIDTDGYGGGDFGDSLWSSEDVLLLQHTPPPTFTNSFKIA